MNNRQAFIFKHFKTLLTTYTGLLPFHSFFNNYTKANSGLGSKDRKILRELLYRTFRLGPIWKTEDPENVFQWIALGHENSELITLFFEGFSINALPHGFDYPFKAELPDSLQNNEYYSSLTRQPLLWVRIKNDPQSNLESFKSQYENSIVSVVKVNEHFTAVGLKNGTLLQENALQFEVQDLASQNACSELKVEKGLKVWDCCSGAGGKSLFLAEMQPKLKLYASDIRPSILHNLKQRFKSKRLDMPKSAVIDITVPVQKLNFESEQITPGYFDIIIADVPCSGSGTWAREPENLSFFNIADLDKIVERQILIVKNALKFVKTGGKLYYITCSVFERENFGVISTLEKEGLVKIVSTKLITGFEDKADNLFVAVLEKL